MSELIRIGEMVASQEDGRLTLRIEKAYASLVDQLARECGATTIETRVDDAVDPDNALIIVIHVTGTREEMLTRLQEKLRSHELTVST